MLTSWPSGLRTTSRPQAMNVMSRSTCYGGLHWPVPGASVRSQKRSTRRDMQVRRGNGSVKSSVSRPRRHSSDTGPSADLRDCVMPAPALARAGRGRTQRGVDAAGRDAVRRSRPRCQCCPRPGSRACRSPRPVGSSSGPARGRCRARGRCTTVCRCRRGPRTRGTIAHAGMSTGVTIGGSGRLSLGSSSKYKASASARLARASSTV